MRNFHKCLYCLRYHVWDDGTLMKRRQCNYLKNTKSCYQIREYSKLWLYAMLT